MVSPQLTAYIAFTAPAAMADLHRRSALWAVQVMRRLRRLLPAITLALITTVGMSAPSEARIKRIQSAKVEFKQEHPCPASGARKGPCKGYVIDHINALACGGTDTPSNMQWQTVADGRAKDKWERKQCRK